MLSKSVTFLDFRLSQGSVATCCMRGVNLYFPTNQLVKECCKSVHIY